MNKNLLLYGALGFLVVRYLIKQRQNATANANTVTTIDLPPLTRTTL
jgi:hypothetical protein